MAIEVFDDHHTKELCKAADFDTESVSQLSRWPHHTALLLLSAHSQPKVSKAHPQGGKKHTFPE